MWATSRCGFDSRRPHQHYLSGRGSAVERHIRDVDVASSILADETVGETRVLACSHRAVNAVHDRRWWFDSTLTHFCRRS